jgi:hypothetical protein
MFGKHAAQAGTDRTNLRQPVLQTPLGIRSRRQLRGDCDAASEPHRCNCLGRRHLKCHVQSVVGTAI